MKTREFYVPSSDGKHRLHGIEWVPDAEIRAVLQISHGMVEHIKRYEEFAVFLTAHGIAVFGHDHLGHGKTAKGDADFGFFAEKAGHVIPIRDLRRMTAYGKKRFPGVPFFLLGHSMGSFFVRRYLTVYRDGLDGAILMGTGGQRGPSVGLGYVLSLAVSAIRGSRYRSRLIYELSLGNYSRHFPEEETNHAWLSRDPQKVREYEEDAFCQFIFTAGAYRDFFRLILEVSRAEKAGKLPKTLPILFLSGSEDPVGGWEKGVRRVFRRYAKAGNENLTLGFYREARHELLNEINRDEVYGDILEWLEKQLSDVEREDGK